MANSPPPEIKKLQAKLLDLTYRNKMLGLNYNAKTLLRVIDEIPSILFSKLQESKELTFAPIPEPTKDELLPKDESKGNDEKIDQRPPVKAFAEKKGFNTSFDLKPDTEEKPKKNHTDNKIQTLLYTDELDAKLGKIHGLYRGSIDETGTNSLYLTFGALEYYAADASDELKRAPLILYPVRMERKRDVPFDKYTIASSDEEPVFNISLVEKLKSEFSVTLPIPDYSSEDAFEIDEFLKAVEALLKTVKPRWRVVWESNLAHLNFGKALLFKDLESGFWHSNQATNHPVLGAVLYGKLDGTNGTTNPSEFDIDGTPESQIVPLVMDADSSQHQAIQEVLSGKNLVIQGPPGTGKSQTIANMIAALISQGKTVLFIAEKLTALEVVRKRLDNVGLGDFCCEIHSTKTQKKILFEEFKRRRETKYPYPKKIEYVHDQVDKLKHNFSKYIKAIQVVPDGTSKTAYELMGRHLTLAQRISNHVSSLDQISSNIHLNITEENFNTNRDRVVAYCKSASNIRKEFGDISGHPWYCIAGTNLGQEPDNIIKSLKSIESLFRTIENDLVKVENDWKTLGDGAALSIKSILYWSEIVAKLELVLNEPNEHLLSELPKLGKSELEYAADTLSQISNIESALKVYATDIHLLTTLSDNQLSEARETLARPTRLRTLEIGKLPAMAENLRRLTSKFHDVISSVNKLVEALQTTIRFDLTSDKLTELLHLIRNAQAHYAKNPMATFAARQSMNQLATYEECRKKADELKRERKALSKRFFEDALTEGPAELSQRLQILKNASWFDLIFKKTARVSKRWLNAALTTTDFNRQQKEELLAKLVSFRFAEEQFLESKEYGALLGNLFCGIDTNFSTVDDEILHLNLTAKKISDCFSNTPIKVENFTETIMSISQTTVDQVIQTHTTAMREFSELIEEMSALSISQAITIVERETAFLQKILSLEILHKSMKIVTTVRDEITVVGILQDRLASVKSLNGYIPLLELAGCDMRDLPGSHKKMSDAAKLKAEITFAGLEGRESLLFPVRRMKDTILNWERLATNARTLLNSVQISFRDFETRSIGSIIESIEYLTSHSSAFSDWQEYSENLDRLRSSVFSQLQPLLDTTLTDEIAASDASEYLFTEYLVRRQVSNTPILSKFKGHDFEESRAMFKNLDLELLNLNRRAIAALANRKQSVPEGRRSNKKSELSELALVDHQITLETRHIPIRQLMIRAQRACMALKPCFMMSPMSVAQFLPIEGRRFDVVVMDEASQLPLEMAIGAIARGNQLVVVGDSKQLPPSVYFETIIDHEPNEDEEFSSDDAESVLQHAETVFHNRRTLKWHYRSEHESLIAFSNSEFYGNSLVLFPAAIHQSDILGVKFKRVNGKYLGAGINELEAKEVVAALKRHVVNSPNQSFGIGTLNLKQKILIEELIDKEGKEDPVFRSFLESRPKGESFFVKNLENLQGDERDVMLISVTYGYDEHGAFHKRFGPINSKYGPRRLNVLFSRARVRTEVFCSFEPEDLDGASSEGAKVLRRFLLYARDGKLSVESFDTGRPPDSEFESSVAQIIRELGFTATPQVGVAGYFIDIGVGVSEVPGKYILGIECDGATYHSSKSARDRDRLRQQNLEKLGWRIHRIWSTDWFKSRSRVIERLKKVLAEASGRPLPSEKPVKMASIGAQSYALEMELKEKLIRFRQLIVIPGSPTIPREDGILRTDILNALCADRPTTEREFLEMASRRNLIYHDDHAAYLPEIVGIIRTIIEVASKVG